MLAGLLLLIAETVALTWAAPYFLIRRLERLAGGALLIGDARASFPPAATFADVRSTQNDADHAVRLQRLTLRPLWVSGPWRTLWMGAVEVEEPFLRISRSRAGILSWPLVFDAGIPDDEARRAGMRSGLMRLMSGWRVHVRSLTINDGVVEFLDAKPEPPFHGAVQHVSLKLGPLTVPPQDEPTSFALRGQVVGQLGQSSAPLYCSGWVNFVARDLQATCKLDAVSFGVFSSYLQGGKIKIRPYQSLLKATSHWQASENALHARVQLDLSNLLEGDISAHGLTVLDVKKIIQPGEERSLGGELKITGPLDDPLRWQMEFLAGGPRAERILNLLLERKIRAVRISFLGRKMPVSLVPVGETVLSEIQATSREIEDALAMLAEPPEPPQAPAASAPATPQEPAAPLSGAPAP